MNQWDDKPLYGARRRMVTPWSPARRTPAQRPPARGFRGHSPGSISLTRSTLFLFLVFMQFPATYLGIEFYRPLGVALAALALITNMDEVAGSLKSRCVLIGLFLFSVGVLGSLHFGHLDSHMMAKMVQNLVLLTSIVLTVKRPSDFQTVLWGLATGGFLSVTTGLWEARSGDFYRVGGILGNANGYGQVCALTCISFTGLAVASQRVWRKIVLLVLTGPCMLGLVYSGSRGAIVALVAGLSAFLLLRSTRVFGALLLILGILLVLNFAPSSFYERARSTLVPRRAGLSTAAETRTDLFQRGLRVYADYPVAGVGFGNVQLGMAEAKVEAHQVTHNAFAQLAAETGTLGLAGFVVLLMSTGTSLLATARSPSLPPGVRALVTTFFALCVAVAVGQSSSGNYVHAIWYIIFGLGPGVTAARQAADNSRRAPAGGHRIAGRAPA